ncbi:MULTISPECIES: hypothetical protein [Streptomyces]|uniref:hypothetical protein n=1 Tax=Streptomyces TaxID=1883 RepID=UPI00226DF6AC|nr:MULTISPECIES: hypothetical protein [unclassified Streptomyces]MCY0923277.1 hypothetical protein [Streptomyces sp. H27-G5]MCY0943980.1 hypothetical protein [Streptomyces sp. H34-AA3]MCY0956300.1 hypothetical protein [Streptomyces sp. H27-H5]MCZ4082320.1 hypothetical protein [Streptomyces sp. H34-S5]
MTLTITDLPAPAVPRDGWGRPLVVPKGGGTPKPLTRTTTYIDCIEDKAALTAWKSRMTLVGASRDPAMAARAKELNPDSREGKTALDELTERAVSLAGANRKREYGTHLHTLSEAVDRGEPLPAGTSDSDVADMAAYKMATVGFDTVAIEQFVVVDELGVGGTFDRLLHYSGPGPDGRPFEGLLIGDLKTGSVQYGGLKMASQLAVYAHGEQYDHTRFPVDGYDKKALAKWRKVEVPGEKAEAAYAEAPGVNHDWGVIIHLPAGEAQCTLYWADLRLGWEAALLARDIRRMRSTRGALVEFPGSAQRNV